MWPSVLVQLDVAARARLVAVSNNYIKDYIDHTSYAHFSKIDCNEKQANAT